MTADHTPRGTELDADDDWAELVGQLKAERDHEMLQRLTAEAERHEFAEQLRFTQGQLFRVTAERDQLAAQLKNEWIGAAGERAIFVARRRTSLPDGRDFAPAGDEIRFWCAGVCA